MIVTEPKPAFDLLKTLQLYLTNGVGPRTWVLLMERFGTPDDALAATASQLQEVPGIGPKLAAAIIASRNSGPAERELARCQQLQVQILQRGRDGYPAWLTEIPDPPPLLYAKGDFAARDKLAIAIVGSRRCTLYGQQQAERLANQLARAGVTIVSGLARGIDGAAHRGALTAGGRTIAVLATGVVDVYPPEHEDLAREVASHGVVVSESPLGQAPTPGMFPQRNRIISGLSLGVIVIEAARNSGALYTARHAMEQNREVFAVPGRIDSVASEGCHDLIRDGATLVRNVDDVLQSLGPLSSPAKTSTTEAVHAPRELLLNDQEKLILNTVTADPQHIDEIVRAVNQEPSRVLQTLTILEMKRLVRRLPGGHLARM
jgi:DNA processing protein